jgi:hypothetical protein
MTSSRIPRSWPPPDESGRDVDGSCDRPWATIDFRYYCHHSGLELAPTSLQAEVVSVAIQRPVTPVLLPPDRPIG